MKEITGDLIKLALKGEFDVIIHGCNCFNTMGKGIAKQIKEVFPDAFYMDQRTKKGDKSKLGTFTYVSAMTKHKHFITIVNAYTQYDYNLKTGNKLKVDYNALRKVFKEIKTKFKGKKIGYPLIGAGLAGGDWNIISKIIDEKLQGEDHPT